MTQIEASATTVARGAGAIIVAVPAVLMVVDEVASPPAGSAGGTWQVLLAVAVVAIAATVASHLAAPGPWRRQRAGIVTVAAFGCLAVGGVARVTVFAPDYPSSDIGGPALALLGLLGVAVCALRAPGPSSDGTSASPDLATERSS